MFHKALLSEDIPVAYWLPLNFNKRQREAILSIRYHIYHVHNTHTKVLALPTFTSAKHYEYPKRKKYNGLLINSVLPKSKLPEHMLPVLT